VVLLQAIYDAIVISHVTEDFILLRDEWDELKVGEAVKNLKVCIIYGNSPRSLLRLFALFLNKQEQYHEKGR